LTFLFLNQTFYPDVVASGQYLAEIAVRLVERGHQVTVVTSRFAYDDPGTHFPMAEVWRGIRIIRVGSTRFGKGAKWRRAMDFGTFLALCVLRLLFMRRQDVVVALTSPPLISFLGAIVSTVRRSRFYYWVLDLNPDEAIAAGWLRPESLAAHLLEFMSRFSLKRAKGIIALDHFMRDRIQAKGISGDTISVIPPWSYDAEIRFDAAGRERFREAYGLDGKFVVMYSGNHSPVHPLDTLLAAARQLATDPEVLFCFVGGGSEWRRIRERAQTSRGPKSPGPPFGNSNILCLPYQPLDQLAGSLSAADLHVVVMGNKFVGLVHPCKIYNALCVGVPVLYIGPRPSHLSEMLDRLHQDCPCAYAAHGEVEWVVQEIKRLRCQSRIARHRTSPRLSAKFSKELIMPRLIQELEGGKKTTSRN
jgi:colanic acid biosynthesis glycosyl transferase WcaI